MEDRQQKLYKEIRQLMVEGKLTNEASYDYNYNRRFKKGAEESAIDPDLEEGFLDDMESGKFGKHEPDVGMSPDAYMDGLLDRRVEAGLRKMAEKWGGSFVFLVWTEIVKIFKGEEVEDETGHLIKSAIDDFENDGFDRLDAAKYLYKRAKHIASTLLVPESSCKKQKVMDEDKEDTSLERDYVGQWKRTKSYLGRVSAAKRDVTMKRLGQIARQFNKENGTSVYVKAQGRLGKDNPNANKYQGDAGKKRYRYSHPYQSIDRTDASHFDVYVYSRKPGDLGIEQFIYHVADALNIKVT